MHKLAAFAWIAALAVSPAAAGTVISNGKYSVGIGTDGELGDLASSVGFRRLSDGFDPLAQGSLRDAWSVSLGSDSAIWADQSLFGSNVGGSSLTLLGPDGARVNTSSQPGLWQLNVTQTYDFVAENILRVRMTVDNLMPFATLLHVQRNWKVDLSPDFAADNGVGPLGSAPGIIDASIRGSEHPDAAIPYEMSCLMGCNGLGDGGGLKWGGSVEAGQSRRIDFYYGISQAGQSSRSLVQQAFGTGAQIILLAQSGENGQWPAGGGSAAFLGVDSVVPEPATWAMMIAGFALTGAALRRRPAL